MVFAPNAEIRFGAHNIVTGHFIADQIKTGGSSSVFNLGGCCWIDEIVPDSSPLSKASQDNDETDEF